MINVTGTNAASKRPRWLHSLNAGWHWLIEPSASVVEPEHRLRARLLMAMLLILIILGVLSLILSLFGVYSDPKTVDLTLNWITLIAILLLAVEYGLSRTVHYQLVAVLVVITLLCATFFFAIVNPENLQFLYFLILGGLTASLFLSARLTAIIFAVTLIGLMFLPSLTASISTSKIIYAFIFILTVGALVVMAAFLRQSYLDQIASQTQLLVTSEARLRELSIRDPLTGLFNRRYLEEVLVLEMIRAERKQYTIGIIMADIDHFKKINDAHGHPAGDAVLVRIASLLRVHVRSSDVICRYGGEEFVLFLPEASQKVTQMRAEQLRDSARQLHMQYEDQTLEPVTLSMGVAVFPEHGATYDAILGAADTAMYRAKGDGRNRVVVAG